MRRYSGVLKPRSIILQRCNLCGKPSGGFYCIYHTKKRNEYERAKRRLEKREKEAFIMNGRKVS